MSDEIGAALVRIVDEVGRREKFLQIYPDCQRVFSTTSQLFAHILSYLIRARAFYESSKIGKTRNVP
jgi:hypothetical protein